MILQVQLTCNQKVGAEDVNNILDKRLNFQAGVKKLKKEDSSKSLQVASNLALGNYASQQL